MLQTVENEVEPSFQLPKTPDTSCISQLTNNVLKRAKSGNHERRITELVDQSQNVSKN